MVRVNRKISSSAVRFWPGMTAKIAAAFVLCLGVQILLAQAPPAPDSLVQEEVDAQNYKIQKPHEGLRKNKAAVGKEQTSVRQVLGGQISINEPAARARFRAYFLQYLYPMMTTEEGLKDAAQQRQNLLRDLMTSKSPEAHREVVDLSLSALKRIVLDNAYRPAARYNAMYIISSLNDVEPNNVGAIQTLPEPMKEALPFIYQQFQKGDTDEIKVAALLGLSRHLEWDNYKQPPSTPMQPAAKAAAVKALTELAEDKAAPPGRNPEVHTWMRRRAIEGLGMACLTKSDAEVAATMERMLKDETEEMSVRLTVAATLGRMSLQAPAKIDAVATARELGYLALVACDAELTRAEAKRKADFEHEARLMGTYSGDVGSLGTTGMPGMSGMPGGGMMMPGGSPDGTTPGVIRNRPTPGTTGMPGEGGYGNELGVPVDPSMMDPKHFMVDFLRRKLRQQIYAVQLGLLGGEDKVRPKAGAVGGTPPPAPAGANEKKEPRGMYAVAKPGKERTDVDEVYYNVRKLAEVVEGAGTDAEFYQLVKDMRGALRPLEAITKRLPPPGAVPTGSGNIDDGPSGPSPVGKGAPGKAGPPKGGPVPAAKPGLPGKTAIRPQPQPGAFAKPRSGR
jgi:hypothetical protein